MSDKHIYKVNYWLKSPEGEVIDTSEGGEPMLIDQNNPAVIEGLRRAVLGRQPGDRLEVTVPPEMAYGEHNPEFVSQVPMSAFEGVEHVVEGMKFQTNTGNEAQVVQVVKVEKDHVLVDANHPLAGLSLNFDLEVIEVVTE
jgi:FKBP-type peptidyl-prolyl cis-trans isomerase SlyD